MLFNKKLTFIIRILLGTIFIVYGVVKLLGIQLAKLNLHGDINDIDPVTLVWYFFGYSQFYAKFIGVTELLAGLLMFPKLTKRLGTMMIFGLGVNITVMDFCFDFPEVKYNVMVYTLLTLLLLIDDYKFYLKLFFTKDDN
ncbi:hypothetical protein GCM10027037_07070 [Mucilaginibacter koreensis]